MQPERQSADQEGKGRAGRVAWSLLAVFLILFPLIAVGRIMVATDDELSDIRAQALAEMAIEHRNLVVTYNSSFGWHQSGAVSTYALNYDVAVLKVNARIALTNIVGTGIYALNYYGANFWNAGANEGGSGNTWDFYLDSHVWGDVVDGGSSAAMIMNGLRVEVAYDDIDNSQRRFLFFRIGTDDQRGRFSVNQNLRYISLDGVLDNNLEGTIEDNYLRMNNHRQTLAAYLYYWTLPAAFRQQPLSAVNYMDFGPLGSGSWGKTQGVTDFYISIADTITSSTRLSGSGPTTITNDGRALGPWNMARDTIPGRGLWMHFQRGFTSAEVSLW